MNIDLKGFNEQVATFKVDDTVKAGHFVRMSEDDMTVTLATGDSEFIGYCLNVRDGYGAIQLSGYVEAPVEEKIYTGKAPLASRDGKTIIGNDSAIYYLVVKCTDDTIGFIL